MEGKGGEGETDLADKVAELDLHVLDRPANVGDVRRRSEQRNVVLLRLEAKRKDEGKFEDLDASVICNAGLSLAYQVPSSPFVTDAQAGKHAPV